MSKYEITIEKNIKLNLNLEKLSLKIDGCDKNEQVALNLSQLSFISPETLIVLVTASKILYDKTGKTIEWNQINSNTYSYLERIDVGNLDFITLKKPSSAKKYNRSKTSENLVELSVITDWKEIGEAIQKTRGVINKWFPYKSAEYRNDLVTLIKETVENSIDHSGGQAQKGVCYYIVQRYELNNGDVEVQIVVGDAGVGMLTSLRRVFPNIRDDVEAICGALLYGKSGRKMGGGLGYHAIKDALLNLKGELTICSGMGIINCKCDKNNPRIYRIRMKNRYPGTQIVFHCKG